MPDIQTEIRDADGNLVVEVGSNLEVTFNDGQKYNGQVVEIYDDVPYMRLTDGRTMPVNYDDVQEVYTTPSL